jgi:hypothetical protein
MQFRHAIELQWRRVALKGQAAQNVGRQIAAIERQTNVTRQAG